MIYKYLGIIILIIIILFIFNYCLFYHVESFNANRTYSKKYILEDCQNNWAKINNLSAQNCNNQAWVKDPRYLCGICGDNDIPLKYIPPANNSNNPIFYGCNSGQSNQLGINWTNNTSSETADSFIGDTFTCNKINKSATSGLYLFISSTVTPSIVVNGNSGTKINIDYLNNSFFYCYYYENISYNTLFTINIDAPNYNGCINISYIWNKQIFILDKNGYETSANIIKYYINNQILWVNNKNSDSLTPMLPWMKTWIMMDSFNKVNNLTIKFYVGQNQFIGKINNDLVAWVGITNFGGMTINGKNYFGDTNSLWGNEVKEFLIPNIVNTNTLNINTLSAGFLNTCLTLTFIWHGIFYSFSSSLNGFNSVIALLNSSYQLLPYTSVRYCDLPVVITGEGPCNGCADNNDSLCIAEQNYYRACNFVAPSNNLLFNTDWIYSNNYTSPGCGCMCSCATSEDPNCCIYGIFCNQFSTLSWSVTISDDIFPKLDNNYV